ncbi:MAG: mechanosensitive ion channel family protein [Opitutaceae bacterium]
MNGDVILLKAALVAAGLALPVYLVLIGAAQLLRKTPGLRFGWTYHAFAGVAGMLTGVQLAARFVAVDPDWNTAFLPHLTAALILLATMPAIRVINHFLWRTTQPDGQSADAPRLLADTTGILVFVAATLAVLQFVYGLKVPGLVAGSGVIAIILGLAMQDLLGNIFGGLSIYLEKPFTSGDWLLVDGQHARVVEVTWRSTRLITNNEVLIDVPNSHITKNTITNFARPTTRHAISVQIGLHYNVPPQRAQDVLREAATSVKGVCADPAPCVFVKNFADSSIDYEVKVWIDDHGPFNRIMSDVRAHCWYAVQRAGMEIPFPIVTLHRPKPPGTEDKARAAASAALRGHSIFGFLAPEDIAEIVRNSPLVLFASGEHLIEQGEVGESMLLIVQGRVRVNLTRNGQTVVLTELGAGDCVGEMALLTGEPRNATVVAITEVEAVEIRKEAFASYVRKNPETLTRLTELLTQRQLTNEKQSAGGDTPEHRAQVRATMMNRLRGFFQLGDSTGNSPLRHHR